MRMNLGFLEVEHRRWPAGPCAEVRGGHFRCGEGGRGDSGAEWGKWVRVELIFLKKKLWSVFIVTSASSSSISSGVGRRATRSQVLLVGQIIRSLVVAIDVGP